ncbi:MAG: DUF4091 domain-containing protein [Clostridia bacterium]|nr:DUF4091 domain-containing protein [Clostridia bacterium]
MIHWIQQSCLEKVTVDFDRFKKPYDHAVALIGEEIAYQIVLYNDKGSSEPFTVEDRSDLPVHLHLVKQVPITWPYRQNADGGEYLLDKPGILPDCLVPIKSGEQIMIGPNLTVLWVCAQAPIAHKCHYRIRFFSENEEVCSDFTCEVLDHELSRPSMKIFEHIYPTSVALDHHVPLFSDVHWSLLERYFAMAAKHGVTDLLTPIFPVSYPSIGVHEAVQLVQIEKEKSRYHFHYDLFDCWVLLARKQGIHRFVFPPLFPHIKTHQALPFVAYNGYRNEPLFEDIDCFDPQYRVFITAFLRSLAKHLREMNLDCQVSFQLTDGVSEEHLETYIACKMMVYDLIQKFNIMDPVSNLGLYRRNLFASPIIPLGKLYQFLEEPTLYSIGYFDPSGYSPVADLLIAGSSARLRSLGLLSYKYNITALFNRGFNYSNSAGAAQHALNLDGGNAYPSGAMSLVYPGQEGPLPSIRLKLLQYALQDLRALEALEMYLSHEQILAMIRRECPVEMDKANTNAEKLLVFREKVNRLLIQYSKK